MKIVKSPDLASFISSASAIAEKLREHIAQCNYDEADKASIPYEKTVQSILNYPISSLTELKLKISFIFENLLVDADSEENLKKYKIIIENDLALFNKTHGPDQ
jgi:hypothetical protein